MKVNFNVLGLTCDGGSRVVCELANGLVDRGYSVSITSMGNFYLGWMDYAPLNKKVEVRFVKPSFFMRGFRKAYLTKRGWNYNLREVFMRSIPDCDVNVSAHSLLAYPMLVSGKGTPFHLVQAYEPQTQYSKDMFLKRESEFAYRLPMKQLCVSKALAEKVNGVNISNGVDTNFYRPQYLGKRLRSVMGINTRPTISWKNGSKLEMVFSELRKRGFEVLSPRHGIPDTEFVRWYSVAEVYMFLSWSGYEGFGLQPLEAMACGAAVVTSPVVYAKHLENAFVLPHHFGVSDVVDAVEKISDDQELRLKLVRGGLETATDYDFSKVVDAFVREIQ